MGSLKEPWVQSHSGKVVNLFLPNPDDIHIDDIAHALAQIPRFTGHLDNPVSVAQHSIVVSYLVPERWAREALLHDAAEAYFNDVNSVAKKELPEYCFAHDEMLRCILKKFGCEPELPKLIHEADAKALRLEIIRYVQYGTPLWKKYIDNPMEYKQGKILLPEGWDWKKAKLEFLTRFTELFDLPYMATLKDLMGEDEAVPNAMPVEEEEDD